MDTHFQLPSITPSGHENSHGVHLCHKCGWPFPKLHPSSKHRRAHKRICGTIEGYKLTHLSGSDDEQDHPSDDDCKTPSPKIKKRSIAGVGERSYRSEDEVFSDAVAEFSDSGMSPGSEEQLEDAKELEKNVRKNVVDDDIYSTGTLKVDADCDSAKPMGSQPAANIVLSSGLVESTHSGKDKAEMSNHGLSLFSAPVENTKAIVDAVQIKGYLAQDMMDGSSSQLSEIHGTNMEEKEATHVQSVSNDLPMVEDAEKQKVLKSEFPLVLGSVAVKRTLNKDNEDMPEGQSIEPAKTLTGFECERTAHDLSHLSGCAKHDSSAGTVLVGVDPTQDEDSGAHCVSVEICNTNRENEEETTHVLSVARDLIVGDHADLMLQDFKDHRTFKSRFPLVGSENVNRSLEGDSEVMVIEESPLKLHSVKLGGASNSSADMDDVEEDMITIEGHVKDLAVTIGKTFDNEELEVPPSTSRSKRENTQLNCSLQRVEPYYEASHTESTGTILSDCDNSKHNVMARAEEVDTEGNEVSERVTRNEHSAEANTILVYEDGNQAPKLRHNNGVEHVDIMMNFLDEAWIDDSTEAAAVEKVCTPTMTNLEPEHELSYTNHTESTDTILCDGSNNNNHNVMVRGEEVDTDGNENSERVKHSAEANTIVYEDGNQAPKLGHNNGVEHVDITVNFPDEASVGDTTEAAAVEKFSTPSMTNLQPEHELSNTNHTESTDTVFSYCKNNNHNVMARAEEVHTEGSENSESVARNEHSAKANTILVNEDGNQAAKLTHNTEGEHVDVTMNFSDEAWIEDSTEAAAVEKFSTTTMTNIEPEHKILSSNYSTSVQETPISSINTNISATIMPAHPSSNCFSDNDSHEVSTEPELNSGDEIVVKCVDGGIVDSKFVQSGDVEVEDDISKRPIWKDEETLPIHSEISHESLPDIKTENEMDGKFEIMQKNDVKFDRQAGDASAIILSVDLSNQMESVEGNWGSVSVLSAQSDQPVAGTGVQPKIDPEGPDKSESTKLHKEIASERLDLHNADVFDPPSFMTLVEPRGSDQEYATSKGPDNSESTMLHQEIASERLDFHKADVFEPPSFMSLVEPRGGSDQENATSEIDTVQATQHSKTEVIQAGWVPSLSNVVNESPGRKKNEEMIAKVTNWSTTKQHSTPLKNLLGEAKEETRTKSPSPRQTETNIQTNATEAKGNVSFATTVKEVLGSEASAGDRTVRGVTAEEWNSPARFPVEIKKQKKKANGKPFWVPFACCSSVN